jgi:NAD(P)-dependent dehydrogenase (short-subunit alcohol dehydrogenase family)
MERDDIVLITGGASGIGAAFARQALARGARVCIGDRSDRARAAFLAAHTAHADRLECVSLDVRDQAAVKAWIDDILARHGRVDWLFNVAGTGVAGEMLEYGPDDFRYIIEVNLLGVAYAIQAAYPAMVARGSGHIVSVASMSGLMPSPFTVSYAASKFGVVGLSRSLRAEACHYGINVSVICPGVIDTPILDEAGEFGRSTRPLKQGASRAMFQRLRPMNVDRFAERALAQVYRNRAIIVVPRWWNVVWWINRLCIPLADFLAARGFLEMKKQVEENTER